VSIPNGRRTVVPDIRSIAGTTLLLEEVTYPRILQLSSVPTYTSPLFVSPAFKVMAILSLENRSCGCSYSNFPFKSCSIFFFKIIHLTSFVFLLERAPKIIPAICLSHFAGSIFQTRSNELFYFYLQSPYHYNDFTLLFQC